MHRIIWLETAEYTLDPYTLTGIYLKLQDAVFPIANSYFHVHVCLLPPSVYFLPPLSTSSLLCPLPPSFVHFLPPSLIIIQDKLGEVVYVELPVVGTEVEKGDQVSVFESVKAVAEVYTSLSGEVTEVNEELENSPNLINDEPFGKGM
jgi:hypothetical protein